MMYDNKMLNFNLRNTRTTSCWIAANGLDSIRMMKLSSFMAMSFAS